MKRMTQKKRRRSVFVAVLLNDDDEDMIIIWMDHKRETIEEKVSNFELIPSK